MTVKPHGHEPPWDALLHFTHTHPPLALSEAAPEAFSGSSSSCAAVAALTSWNASQRPPSRSLEAEAPDCAREWPCDPGEAAFLPDSAQRQRSPDLKCTAQRHSQSRTSRRGACVWSRGREAWRGLTATCFPRVTHFLRKHSAYASIWLHVGCCYDPTVTTDKTLDGIYGPNIPHWGREWERGASKNEEEETGKAEEWHVSTT